jgi:DNA-binding NarL/FixJ family response regulator
MKEVCLNNLILEGMRDNKERITVGITDDEQLFVKSLSTLINTFKNFVTSIEALNGEALLKKLDSEKILPEILLLDVKMSIMDGLTTAQAVTKKYPHIKIVALSTNDDDTTVINMLKAGCCSYLLKDIHPIELEKALNEIHSLGYYNADMANTNYRRLIVHDTNSQKSMLSDRELSFLKLACSDLTYKQIASQMHLSERTIDGYRESLFEKLNVQSRVGMALEAIRKKIVPL